MDLAVQDSRLATHLVLWDKDCGNHARYGIHSWPVAYLIGRDGKVMWEGRPSKAFVPSGGEQTVVDKRTKMDLKRLVSLALKESSRGGVAWKRKEAKP